MRTIELQLGSEDLRTFAVPMDRLFNAIGYLSTWNMSHPKVIIRRGGKEDDLVAHYFLEDGSCGYTIGAVWHDDHYGFHS